MQFSTLKSALLAGALAIVGASAETTYKISADPESFLNTNFYQISWVNNGTASLFAGDIKFSQRAEPFLALISDSRISFLSYHSERYMQLYVMEDETGAVQVDEWQMIPRSANQTSFAVDSDGYLGFDGDNNKWTLCPTDPRTYQLWFVGDDASAPSGCIPTKLKAEATGGCS